MSSQWETVLPIPDISGREHNWLFCGNKKFDSSNHNVIIDFAYWDNEMGCMVYDHCCAFTHYAPIGSQRPSKAHHWIYERLAAVIQEMNHYSLIVVLHVDFTKSPTLR